MDGLYDKLIGALIGLSRATDGNEHLISSSSTAVIIESLTAHEDDRSILEELLRRAGDEKRKMVPDCFLCANPCGRTSDFDLAQLQRADPEIRELKVQILSGLKRIAASAPGIYDEKLLYKGLVVIGMEDYSADDLRPIVREIEETAQ